MIIQDNAFQRGQRGLYGLHLPNDIDAIAVVDDHLRNTAHLSLNAGKALGGGLSRFRFHVDVSFAWQPAVSSSSPAFER